MSGKTTLLKNGTLLLHSDDGNVNPIVSDLLIRGNLIERIAEDITPEGNATVIDCTDKIVSPGFIDTHRHMWHTQMKGYADSLLFDYLGEVNFIAGPLYKPEDVFWGQLAGCLEALDAGTTTVVDHSHINHAPENSPCAISATLTSGIRSFYCYCPNIRVTAWSPEYTIDTNPAPWFQEQLGTVASLPDIVGHKRVIPGLAFDGVSAPRDVVENVIGAARQLKLGVITMHHTAPLASIKLLSDYNLLSKDMIFSHANAITDEEISLLATKGGFISSTPSTELQMGIGAPVCSNPELRPFSSIGVDCHSTTSADLFGQMRLLLQSARNKYNETLGKIPSETNITVQEVFNMGTIHGAKVVGLEDSLGSLKEGKLADIVIFDGSSPAMVCGSPKDPVGAIVLHSSVRDVHTVIVDGVIRKSRGSLLPSRLEVFPGMGDTVAIAGDKEVPWDRVAKEVAASRVRVEDKMKEVDIGAVKRVVWKLFGL